VQGNPEVIEHLNEVLTAELTAVNQYFLDSKMFANWGYGNLADHFRTESIDEMKDADSLIERILFLDGHPNVQRLGSIRTGEDPVEKLSLAAQLELEAIERLNRGIVLCYDRSDHGSRELLEEILKGEEGHLDWLDSQLHIVEDIGKNLYLSRQVDDDD
jgi:bacterioferritin